MNDPMIGRTIGRYRITGHLGRGGMAEVYKAYQPNLDRYVVLKVMYTFLSDEKEFLARFEREAKVVATLRHPNIVQVYDFNNDNGVYYMVFEFIPGETLQDRLKRLSDSGRQLSIEEAIKFTVNICDAVGYAHQRGMVHRDIKPANIMVTPHGDVKILDFGLAKLRDHSQITRSGSTVGRLQGHDYFRIMAATGHTTLNVFKRYNRVIKEELKALVGENR